VGCTGVVDGEIDDNFDDDDAASVIVGDAGAAGNPTDASPLEDAVPADGGVFMPPIDGGAGPGNDAGIGAQDSGVASGVDSGVASDAATANDAGTGVDSGPGPVDDSVPAGAHCDPVRNWPAENSAFEQEVLRLTNIARTMARYCGPVTGSFKPAAPLTISPQLRCSARLHSKYMLDNNEFAHTQAKTQLTPAQRMTAAGYKWSYASENIAAGQPTPKSVVDGWLASDGHCGNIMSPSAVHLGVGIAVKRPGSTATYGQYWTQNFGSPR